MKSHPVSEMIFSLAVVGILLSGFAPSQEQEREYTKFERERFDLDLKFEATVILVDGTKFDVSDFHIGIGLYRHKIDTGGGSVSSGLLLPLSNVKRIYKNRPKDNWANIVFLNDSEMHTQWGGAENQKLYGKKKDGSRWEATIHQIREVHVRQVDTEDK